MNDHSSSQVMLRINPGVETAQSFWDDLLKDSKTASEANGVFVFQLLDDGEIPVPLEPAIEFWSGRNAVLGSIRPVNTAEVEFQQSSSSLSFAVNPWDAADHVVSSPAA